jgi:hypothetical protein
MYGSKLVAGAGQRFEFARRLPLIGLGTGNTRYRSDTWEQVSADCGSKTLAGSSAVGHPMIRRINVTVQRSLARISPYVMGLLHSLIRLTLMSAGWGTLWHQAPSMRVALRARGYT